MTEDGNRMIFMGDHFNDKNIRTDQHRHQLALRVYFLLCPPRFSSRISPYPLSELLPNSPTLALSFPTLIAVRNEALSLQVFLRLNTNSRLRLHHNLPRSVLSTTVLIHTPVFSTDKTSYFRTAPYVRPCNSTLLSFPGVCTVFVSSTARLHRH